MAEHEKVIARLLQFRSALIDLGDKITYPELITLHRIEAELGIT